MKKLKCILVVMICCVLGVTTSVEAAYPAWTKVDGVFYNDKGEEIKGALAKGIDVSRHQGEIDWEQVKDSDIEFAIIRCGVGEDIEVQDDPYFIQNVQGCEQYQIPYGIYLYSYATDATMAQDEVSHVLRLLNKADAKPQLPIYLDIEDKTQENLSNKVLGDIAEVFCTAMTKEGYQAGVYSNLYFWNNKLTDSRFDNWDRWVAQYNSICDYQDVYRIWQFTQTGVVSGIAANVDINILFTNDCNIIGHIYSTGTVTKKATMKQSGTLTYRCKRCGSSRTETIPPIKGVTLSKTSYTYSGKANKPAVTVKDSQGKIISSSNYTVSYSNNTKPGQAGVKVNFKGNYEGSISTTFVIKPAKVSLSKPVNQKGRKIKLTWKKAAGISGYEILFAKNKTFKKGKKTVTAKATAKTKVISGLKKKQTYYIKIRSYKTIQGKKVYGAWSGVKSVKIKK